MQAHIWKICLYTIQLNIWQISETLLFWRRNQGMSVFIIHKLFTGQYSVTIVGGIVYNDSALMKYGI